jgi:16S rRNA (adenine1518-N6/adenine1519-N6)-dimethyltransferase
MEYKSKRLRLEAEELDRLPIKKKAYGQHFLRNQSVVDHMIDTVKVSCDTTVVEIGCGDGFLTSAILLQTKCKNLIVYEIDPDWIEYVKTRIRDSRLHIKHDDILQVDLQKDLTSRKPLVLLANLPYQITFPILFKIQAIKDLFQEGVVMVQEEVAQKIVATKGKKFSPTSMFLQRHFEWKLLDKVAPGSFIPAPKVFSRTIYFKPKFDLPEIPRETEFWAFLKLCYRSPRQTLRNNLKTTTYITNKTFSSELLALRAQQLSLNDCVSLWKQIIA